jgi:hypothetical protein
VRDAFAEELPSMDWMDDATREAALEKAKKMIIKIGYPDFIADVQQLDDYHADVYLIQSNLVSINIFVSQLEITDSLFTNVMNGRIFYVQNDLVEYGQPVNKDK